MRIGSNKSGQGEQVPVARVIVEPDYLATSGHDITLLQLAQQLDQGADQVAGASEGGLWAPGTMETIAGWGTTSEGGDTPEHAPGGAGPDHDRRVLRGGLQRLRCHDDGLRGLPAGRHGHLPGRLRRPALRPHGAGDLKVVGAT